MSRGTSLHNLWGVEEKLRLWDCITIFARCEVVVLGWLRDIALVGGLEFRVSGLSCRKGINQGVTASTSHEAYTILAACRGSIESP